MRYAINVLSYNRPLYLAKVLHSLKLNDLKDCEVILWQDGYVKPGADTYDRIIYDMCINTFKSIFPESLVCSSNMNKGVGQMYREMKAWTFERYQAGIFLEDDLVLGKDYIAILKKLYTQTADNLQVGLITAYGPDRLVGDVEQHTRSRELELGIPSWGYLLGKQQYLLRKDILEAEYYPLLTSHTYKDRDHHSILKNYVRKSGFKINSTSQDTADTIAMIRSGQVKLSTVTRNGNYIGAVGEHFSQAEFDSGYYGKDKIFQYDSIPDFVIPSSDRLTEMNLALRKIGFA
jgi:hypothetical protein